MPWFRGLLALACVYALFSASASTASAGELFGGWPLWSRASPASTASYYRQSYPGPGAVPYPTVVSGPPPWYGQAMGSSTFNYGYFGAHQHRQYTSHIGYYGDYRDRGCARGY